MVRMPDACTQLNTLFIRAYEGHADTSKRSHRRWKVFSFQEMGSRTGDTYTGNSCCQKVHYQFLYQKQCGRRLAPCPRWSPPCLSPASYSFPFDEPEPSKTLKAIWQELVNPESWVGNVTVHVAAEAEHVNNPGLFLCFLTSLENTSNLLLCRRFQGLKIYTLGPFQGAFSCFCRKVWTVMILRWLVLLVSAGLSWDDPLLVPEGPGTLQDFLDLAAGVQGLGYEHTLWNAASFRDWLCSGPE